MRNYQEILTEDGSVTLYSRLYHEACHSLSGAINETIAHYVQGCELAKKATKIPHLCVLEIGFGVGVGFIQTKEELAKMNTKFTFISFEIDEELIHIFAKKHQILFKKNDNVFSYKTNEFKLFIILGNARQTIKQIPQITDLPVHAIFQDAFSPKRNSILWTTQWFEDLKRLAHKNCIMSTYSASSSIRKSMISAGWKLYPGEQFGSKRSSTRARLTGSNDADIMDKLTRSPANELTDENYLEYKLGTK
ncbi:MAG: hypothetical protein HON90_18090 [Halobacteriovoraceae bacterium]|jgi:tRNA U34 5-methylaminomethyl-2-thiouridine-forming methyltransferase MnmC|nr:hypothetical protein [Halobacteriovoraceae bacterium]